MAEIHYIKLVVVGDPEVGKTSILIVQTEKELPKEYVPVGFDPYDFMYAKDTRVTYYDSTGTEDYSRLRTLLYPQTDCFMLCFALNDPASLDSASQKWKVDLQHHCPNSPIFLVGTTIDPTSERVVTTDQGQRVAQEIGACGYFEIGSLSYKDVSKVFDSILKIIVTAVKTSTPPKKYLVFRPEPPKNAPAPTINVRPSVIAQELLGMVCSESYPTGEAAITAHPLADILFKIEQQENSYVVGHRVILCSASEFFCRLLLTADEDPAKTVVTKDESSSEVQVVKQVKYLNRLEIAPSCIAGPTKLVEVTLAGVSAPGFVCLLEFLYTGTCQKLKQLYQSDTPIFLEIKRMSSLFGSEELLNVCSNLENDNASSNGEIGTTLNEKTAQNMKKHFLNNPMFADVLFNVRESVGTKQVKELQIPGHRSLIVARCKVAKTMLESNEETVDIVINETQGIVNYLALLEYIYTDHCPLDGRDAPGILALADRFGLTRLVSLCELHISQWIDEHATQDMMSEISSGINVVTLLEHAKAHNAERLAGYCRHFLASNYSQVVTRPDFQKLSEKNRKYLETHQWPPIEYNQLLKQWEEEYPKEAKKYKKGIKESKSKKEHPSSDCIVS